MNRIVPGFSLMALLISLAIPSCAQMSAQQSQAFVPLSGSDFERILNRIFPSHRDTAKNARFAFSLRVLPPFSPEWQVSAVYGYKGQGTVTLTTLEKPLGMMINEELAKPGTSRDLGYLASLGRPTSAGVSITRALAHEWLNGLWLSVAGVSRVAPRSAVKLDDGSGRVEIDLDATAYIVEYTDQTYDVHFVVQGPDPNKVDHIGAACDPIVRWIVNVRKRLDAMITAEKAQHE